MKKLTSLQVLMLMNLALGTSYMYGEQNYMDDRDEAVQLEIESGLDEQATIEVLHDLAEVKSAEIEHIIKDENNLDASFNSIKKFVNAKNREIDALLEQKVVSEAEIARLAVELADAQAMLKKTIAKQRTHHKHNHKYEQAIKDALMKARQGLQSLNKMAIDVAKQVRNSISQLHTKAKKSKSSKAVVKASSHVKKEAPKAVAMSSGTQLEEQQEMLRRQSIEDMMQDINNVVNHGDDKQILNDSDDMMMTDNQ